MSLLLKVEPGRLHKSSDRRDKDQARSTSQKRDHENERNRGRYAWVVIPTAIVTQLCAISRHEGKAKRGNGGKETRRLRMCQIRSELIGSDKSGRVVKHAGADERRERKRGPQLPVFRRGRARGIYKFRVREGDNVRYAGRKMRSGKKVNPEGPTRVFCRRHCAASYVKGGRCSV